jgi:hypothetical protein
VKVRTGTLMSQSIIRTAVTNKTLRSDLTYRQPCFLKKMTTRRNWYLRPFNRSRTSLPL